MSWLQNMGERLPSRFNQIWSSRWPWKVYVTVHKSAAQGEGGPGLNNLRSHDRASVWNLELCPWPLASPAFLACSVPCPSFLCHKSWYILVTWQLLISRHVLVDEWAQLSPAVGSGELELGADKWRAIMNLIVLIFLEGKLWNMSSDFFGGGGGPGGRIGRLDTWKTNVEDRGCILLFFHDELLHFIIDWIEAVSEFSE